MVQFIESSELVKEIPDDATIALVGFGGMGQADKILGDLRDRFLEEGHPSNLTILHPAGQSDTKNGIEQIAYEGLIKKVIGGHWGLAPKMRELIQNNKIECYCLPQGQITQLFRTMANGLPGQISPIGLGTFVDPVMDGGRFNAKAKDTLVERIELAGKPFLFYKSIPMDYVLIRATTADEKGNILANEEPLKLEILSAAQAAKAAGGKVIVQVKYLAKAGSLHPRDIVIPGIFVDYVVLATNPEKEHRQTPSTIFDPIFTGDLKAPDAKIERLPLSVRKIIGRRAIQGLTPGSTINIGIGIPGDTVGPILMEEGLNDLVTVSVESGAIGGVPLGKNEFGISKNAEALLEHANQFDFYHGIGVDVAFMGAAEIDDQGNVNVSRFGGRYVGCGGFIDITQCAKKVVFCFTFTGNGLIASVENGKLSIEQEGTSRKFVKSVEQITFNGAHALNRGTEVFYITERAVFKLTSQGVVLIEIAPGIDLERDILSKMEFRPIISDTLTVFDPAVLSDEPMKESNYLLQSAAP